MRCVTLIALIFCMFMGVSQHVSAAFPMPAVTATTAIIDTAKPDRNKSVSLNQLKRQRAAAVVCSFLSIGLFTAAVVSGISGLLLPWLLLAIIAMVCARNRFSKNKTYTFAEVISFIALLPAIAILAAIFTVVYVVFVAPRMLVDRIRGKKRVYF